MAHAPLFILSILLSLWECRLFGLGAVITGMICQDAQISIGMGEVHSAGGVNRDSRLKPGRVSRAGTLSQLAAS